MLGPLAIDRIRSSRESVQVRRPQIVFLDGDAEKLMLLHAVELGCYGGFEGFEGAHLMPFSLRITISSTEAWLIPCDLASFFSFASASVDNLKLAGFFTSYV